MFGSIAEALGYIRQHDVAMVDLKVTGVNGQWLHLTLPASRLSESHFESGVGYDGSSGSGFTQVEKGDVAARPVLETAFMDPICKHATLSFLCETVAADTHESVAFDPRVIAQKAVQSMRDRGIARQALMAPEFEFYVFDDVRIVNSPFRRGVTIRSSESGPGAGVPSIRTKGGYLRVPPADRLHDLRSEIALTLAKVGVDVRYHHHEVGGPGQCEIELDMTDLVRAADQAMLVKYIVKNVARQYGLVATFMPKPIYGEAGNGMHVHQRLVGADDEPVFFDDQNGNYANFSNDGLNYIAGLLHHGRALTGFTNPSTNSFKRLVEGYEAPVNLFFSLGNRSAAIRIPGYAVEPDEKRMEYRPPDGTANAYLMLAAMLMAGVDGIRNKRYERTSNHSFGPYDVDMAQQSAEFKNGVAALPRSLRDAMTALENDHAFLTADGVFPEQFIQQWIGLKRRHDADPVEHMPHPYEFELYFDA